MQENITVPYIKQLGKNLNGENFLLLIELFDKNFPIEIRREIASSIGRQKNDELVYSFIYSQLQKKHQWKLFINFTEHAYITKSYHNFKI